MYHEYYFTVRDCENKNTPNHWESSSRDELDLIGSVSREGVPGVCSQAKSGGAWSTGCALLRPGSLRSPLAATASVPELELPVPNAGPPHSSPNPISVNASPSLHSPSPHSGCNFSLLQFPHPIEHRTLAGLSLISLKPPLFHPFPQLLPLVPATLISCWNGHDSPSLVSCQLVFLTLLHTANRMVFPQHLSLALPVDTLEWPPFFSPWERSLKSFTGLLRSSVRICQPSSLISPTPSKPSAHPTPLTPLTFLKCHKLFLISHSAKGTSLCPSPVPSHSPLSFITLNPTQNSVQVWPSLASLSPTPTRLGPLLAPWWHLPIGLQSSLYLSVFSSGLVASER